MRLAWPCLIKLRAAMQRSRISPRSRDRHRDQRPLRRASSSRSSRQGDGRYVYRFGGGVSDGGAGDKNLLGGKGANLAEMASIGLPVPPGFTITTEMCTRYYDEGEAFPDSAARRGRRRHRADRGHHRQGLRRCSQSAAGLGALGRARVDAGHDGHGAQPRPQRRDGRGPGRRARATSASRGTAIAASSRCIPTWCSSSITARSRKRWRSPRKTRAIRSTPS